MFDLVKSKDIKRSFFNNFMQVKPLHNIKDNLEYLKEYHHEIVYLVEFEDGKSKEKLFAFSSDRYISEFVFIEKCVGYHIFRLEHLYDAIDIMLMTEILYNTDTDYLEQLYSKCKQIF